MARIFHVSPANTGMKLPLVRQISSSSSGWFAAALSRLNPGREANRDTSSTVDKFINENDDDVDGEVTSDEEPPPEPPKKKRRVVVIPWKPTGPFPFMRLPAELRNGVYEALLINQRSSGPFHASNIVSSQLARAKTVQARDRESARRLSMGLPAVIPRRPKLPPFAYPAILAANKEVHAEAHDIFYTKNVFALALHLQNWDYLPTLPSPRVAPLGWDFAAIRTLRLELVLSSAEHLKAVNWEALFAQMKGLKHLALSVTRGLHLEGSGDLEDWKDVHWIYKAFLRGFVAALPVGADVVLDFRGPKEGETPPMGPGVEKEVVEVMWAEFKHLQGVYLKSSGDL